MMNLAMRRKPIIITLVALGVVGVLGVGLFFLASSSSQITPPSVSFLGYTNDLSGSRRAVFVITNRTGQTFDMVLPVLAGVAIRDSSSGVYIFRETSSRSRLVGSQEAITVWVMRLSKDMDARLRREFEPANSNSQHWSASFTFLLARPPLGFRIRRWWHDLGVSSSDIRWPSVTVTIDLPE